MVAESGEFKLDSFGYYQQLIVKDNKWGVMALLLEKFKAAQDGVELSLSIPQLPDNMDCYAVVAIQDFYQSIGSPVCI